jgi:ribosome-binding protein aMBF1 (putative translation factor)
LPLASGSSSAEATPGEEVRASWGGLGKLRVPDMVSNVGQEMSKKTIALPDLLRQRAAEDPQFRQELARHALGSRIEELRRERRLSQRKLAKIIGSDRSTLRLIEAGERLPSAEQLRKLAEALGAEDKELAEWISIVE